MIKKSEIQEITWASPGTCPEAFWCYWDLGAPFLTTSLPSQSWPLSTSGVSGYPLQKDPSQSPFLSAGWGQNVHQEFSHSRCSFQLSGQRPWFCWGDCHHHHSHLRMKEKGHAPRPKEVESGPILLPGPSGQSKSRWARGATWWVCGSIPEETGWGSIQAHLLHISN